MAGTQVFIIDELRENQDTDDAAIPLAIRSWEFHLWVVDKNKYLVKQELDQSPVAWTIKAVPPQA